MPLRCRCWGFGACMEEIVRSIADNAGSCTVLLKDSVACRGDFMVHYLLRKLLVDTDKRVILLGLAKSLVHYNRVARKQGCNLQGWRDRGRFTFVAPGPEVFEPSTARWHKAGASSGLDSSASDDTGGHAEPSPLLALYSRIRDAAKSMQVADPMPDDGEKVCVIIDDVSVLEVVAGGFRPDVLDFLNYCQGLSCGKCRCSLVLLTHGDIYEEPGETYAGLELEYASDIVISLEPLSTGLAADVHGQLTLLRRTRHSAESLSSKSELPRFQFQISENGVHFFLPGELQRR